MTGNEISLCEYFFAYHHAAMYHHAAIYFNKNQGTDVGGTADKAATLDNFVIARGTLAEGAFVPSSIFYK